MPTAQKRIPGQQPPGQSGPLDMAQGQFPGATSGGPQQRQPEMGPPPIPPSALPSGPQINGALGIGSNVFGGQPPTPDTNPFPVGTGGGPGGPGVPPVVPPAGGGSGSPGGPGGPVSGQPVNPTAPGLIPLQGGAQPAQGGSGGATAAPGGSDLRRRLAELLGQGDQSNQGVIRRRVEGARENLERGRTSEMDSIQALLAERGLLDSGEEAGAYGRLSENLTGQFRGSVQDIYADESARADDRLVQILSLATGLEQSDARNAIDWFNANTGRDLGFGRLNQDWDEFSARYGLDAQRLGFDMSQGNIDNLIRILEQYMRGAGQSGGGYI